MVTISVTDARDEFSELVSRVAYGHERVVLARHGRDVAAIVPAADLELLEFLEDQLDLASAREALADSANATPVSFEEVRARLVG